MVTDWRILNVAMFSVVSLFQTCATISSI